MLKRVERFHTFMFFTLSLNWSYASEVFAADFEFGRYGQEWNWQDIT